MRQPLVAGNWKLNGSRGSVDKLVENVLDGINEVKKAQVVVCPPYVYLHQVSQLLKGSTVAWGSQNVSEYESGAYTGEVSAPMLSEFGCQYAIVGHSERRSLFGETDRKVGEKFVTAQKSGIKPILCVGELLEEREANQTQQVVARQLDAVVHAAGIGAFASAVIAYEPVWAIGTGKTATPEQAQEVHRFIRERIATHNTKIAEKLQILYGGSVNAENAAALFAQNDIDGGLIGGASLNAQSFLAICTAAN